MGLAKPMFVPVTGVPAKLTEALASGAEELVGPFQKRSALVTVPETPVTVIEPVPPLRIPPNPNSPTSVLEIEVSFVSVGVQAVPEHVIPVLTSEPTWLLNVVLPSTVVCWAAVQVPVVVQSASTLFVWFWCVSFVCVEL